MVSPKIRPLNNTIPKTPLIGKNFTYFFSFYAKMRIAIPFCRANHTTIQQFFIFLRMKCERTEGTLNKYTSLDIVIGRYTGTKSQFLVFDKSVKNKYIRDRTHQFREF